MKAYAVVFLAVFAAPVSALGDRRDRPVMAREGSPPRPSPTAPAPPRPRCPPDAGMLVTGGATSAPRQLEGALAIEADPYALTLQDLTTAALVERCSPSGGRALEDDFPFGDRRLPGTTSPVDARRRGSAAPSAR